MPFAPGQIVTAQQLNRLQPRTHQGIANADVTGVQANADVPGATVTFNTETAGAIYVARASFDFDTNGSAVPTANDFNGGLAVDGAVQTARALVSGTNIATQRDEASKQWRGTLAAAGSHTIKLVVSHGHANCITRALHTVLHIEIYEVV